MDILYKSANQSPAACCQNPSSPVFLYMSVGRLKLYLLERLSPSSLLLLHTNGEPLCEDCQNPTAVMALIL